MNNLTARMMHTLILTLLLATTPLAALAKPPAGKIAPPLNCHFETIDPATSEGQSLNLVIDNQAHDGWVTIELTIPKTMCIKDSTCELSPRFMKQDTKMVIPVPARWDKSQNGCIYAHVYLKGPSGSVLSSGAVYTVGTSKIQTDAVEVFSATSASGEALNVYRDTSDSSKNRGKH